MAVDFDRQEYWRHEADKLALIHRLIKRLRITVSLMAAIPLSFSLIPLAFGQSQDSTPYNLMGIMIVMIAAFGSMASEGYVRDAKALIERGLGGTPSPEI